MIFPGYTPGTGRASSGGGAGTGSETRGRGLRFVNLRMERDSDFPLPKYMAAEVDDSSTVATVTPVLEESQEAALERVGFGRLKLVSTLIIDFGRSGWREEDEGGCHSSLDWP
jgi:hypothetical protein